MEREVLTAGGGAVSVISPAQEKIVQSIPLEHAGALCVSQRHVLCACKEAVLCLDRSSLCPAAVFAGGPGMNQLLLSSGGARLYALCADGDSVMMLDAAAGTPLLLSPAGVNPQQMALAGETLAVAGGESGYVLLLCAKTMAVLEGLPMPGPVYSVALGRDAVYALCMTQALSSLLVTRRRSGEERVLALAGMPGRLMTAEDALYAATYGHLYAVSPDGERVLRRHAAPGRASWLSMNGGEMLLLDGLSERLFASPDRGAHWRLLCCNVQAAAL